MYQEMENVSPFDTIREYDEDGKEFWSARALQGLLGYKEWRNFDGAIKRAMTSCDTNGQIVSDHFVEVNKQITAGKGAIYQESDYHLTRYACYLIAMNGDVSKPKIANAQTYFVVQTRKQEKQENSFHVYTLEESLEMNLRLVRESKEKDDKIAQITPVYDLVTAWEGDEDASDHRYTLVQACKIYRPHSKHARSEAALVAFMEECGKWFMKTEKFELLSQAVSNKWAYFEPDLNAKNPYKKEFYRDVIQLTRRGLIRLGIDLGIGNRKEVVEVVEKGTIEHVQ